MVICYNTEIVQHVYLNRVTGGAVSLFSFWRENFRRGLFGLVKIFFKLTSLCKSDIIKQRLTVLLLFLSLTGIAKHFRYGSQEDAHEFLRYTVDAMQKSCLPGTK